jgi:hypothetical protein
MLMFFNVVNQLVLFAGDAHRRQAPSARSPDLAPREPPTRFTAESRPPGVKGLTVQTVVRARLGTAVVLNVRS